MEGNLLVVGSGLQLGHLTMETINAIKNSKKVLYLITDPITETYLFELNNSAETLLKFYAEGKNRRIIYNEIVDYI